MPTGYTAGILDGDIKTFPEFAKQCMRAFGATVHMRDEPLKVKYKPRKPSGYHKEQITKAKGELEYAKRLSDKEILQRHHEKIDSRIAEIKEGIKKTKRNHAKLCGMLDEARNWQPPTDDHGKFKDFMIQQLEETLKFDGSTRYYEERLHELKTEKEKSTEEIRTDMINQANKDIAYHRKELDEELNRCEDANKWVEVLLTSI